MIFIFKLLDIFNFVNNLYLYCTVKVRTYPARAKVDLQWFIFMIKRNNLYIKSN